MEVKTKREKRYGRHRRVRAKISGTNKVPRFCVFRSNKHIYAQLIDDEQGKTLVAVSDQGLKKPKISAGGGSVFGGKNKKLKTQIKNKKTEETQKPLTGEKALAYEVGKLIAEKAIKNKIEKVVFDRGGYQYHGRVKAVADGARDGGLKF